MLDTVQIARQYKIDAYSVQREYAQILFLQALYEASESKDIIFKGGTCIRLLYNGTRFSEDLDFSVQKTVDKKMLVKVLNKAVGFFAHEFEGAYLKEARSKDFADSYTTLLKFPLPNLKYDATIHLDFSFRETLITEPTMKIIQGHGYPLRPSRPLVVAMSKEEILAEKFRAFLYRDAYRDLYDIAHLLQNTKLDSNIFKMIKQKLAYYKKSDSLYDGKTNSTIKRIMAKIESIDIQKARKDLDIFLPQDQRKDQTYTNVITLVTDACEKWRSG